MWARILHHINNLAAACAAACECERGAFSKPVNKELQ